ncbi:unnamed protein product [Rhizoctonia solani]|uniref:Uncharacterized protein n=1 Tax=Rhizoctonia solani TaxID=456999 RepID=A0A8H3GY69_9AGAM|nr:unnamed protein product [Rhizoctonia solani]
MPDVEAPAKAAITRISKVRPNQINHSVSLADLQTILILSRSPASYHCFASRPLTKGCIYLMNSVKISGKVSPFSYEFGYLCFRIMVLALGACLLNDQGQLESVMTDMATDQKKLLAHMFSSRVAILIEDAVNHGGGRGRETYNCILGWSQCQDHPKIEEIISTTDTGLLLALLWGDREQFLQVIPSTLSPGPCGVMYTLWRYIVYQRHRQEISESEVKKLTLHYTDLLWRAQFSATLNQRNAFCLLHSWNHHGFKLWDNTPKCINTEDSRMVVKVLGRQMLDLGTSIALANISTALNYIYHHLTSIIDCEDEIPALIVGVIRQMWFYFLQCKSSEEEVAIVVVISEAFDWLRS